MSNTGLQLKKIVISHLTMGQTIVLLCTLWVVVSSTNSLAQNTWIQKADFGGGGNSEATSFSVGGKGYMGTGYNFLTGGFRKDFWEYNPNNNTWTQKADFGGGNRSRATGIAIGNRGYVGLGFSDISPNIYNDFWEYNPETNTWTQKANFGGGARLFAIGFTIGDKGYIGPGFYYDDLWEYDPSTDSWTQKADFGGGGRTNAIGFSVGTKGYMGTGFTDNNDMIGDFWEYDSGSDAWTQKASFEAGPRFGAVGFSIGDKGYVGTGQSENNLLQKDFWQYDPETNKWTPKADFGGDATIYAAGFSMGGKGYIGTGSGNTGYLSGFWEYTPDESTATCDIPTTLTTVGVSATAAKLKWDAMSGAVAYQVAYKAVGGSQWTKIPSASNHKVINGLIPDTKYTWKVRSVCSTLPLITSDASDQVKFTTAPFRMDDESLQEISFQIYPNPSEDQTTIHFTLLKPSQVCVKVFDVSGREIANPVSGWKPLLNDNLEQGDYSLPITTSYFAKGVYLVRISSDFGVTDAKLIVQ